MVTYKDCTENLTLENALECYKSGVILIINDGRDVTFDIDEKENGLDQA